MFNKNKKWFTLAIATALIISFIYSIADYANAQIPSSATLNSTLTEISNPTSTSQPDPKLSPQSTPESKNQPASQTSFADCNQISNQVKEKFAQHSQTHRVILQGKPIVLPGGELISVKIPDAPDNSIICAFISESLQQSSVTVIDQVISSKKPDEQKTEVSEQASNSQQMTELKLAIPNNSSPWPLQAKKLVVVSFPIPQNQENKLLDLQNGNILVSETANVLSSWALDFIPIFIVITVYMMVAFLRIDTSNAQQNKEIKKISRLGKKISTFKLRSLDPVVITSGQFGKANLPQLQTFWFSLIILSLLIHILLATGSLSDISKDVFSLLGISLAGTTLSRVVDGARQRLTSSNWAWVRNQGWLTVGEKGYKKPPEPDVHASWSDLIKTDGVFDVYRFQMLTFSILVGASIIFSTAGAHSLRNYSLPENINSLFGLSSGFFILGKAIDPASFNTLNTQLDKVRQADSDWQAKAGTGIAGISEKLERVKKARELAPDESLQYFQNAILGATLLKSLFDSIDGTKFENGYIDELDVLPNWLERDYIGNQDLSKEK